MSEFVADTHAISWHLTGNPTPSVPASRIFSDADAGQDRSLVPGVSLVEFIYLVERGRMAPEPYEELLRGVEPPERSYALAPLDQGTARAMRRVSRAAVPDMPDRIIVATALRLGLPRITRDGAIHRLGVVPILCQGAPRG